MTLADLLPQPPWFGPPLPRFLNIYWPWVQSQGEGLSLPLLPRASNYISPTDIVTSEPALTTYENIEEVELVDIDPDLLMPRKIIIHRKSKEIR
jgi:hypothetical protein